jgi:hypothetical protein
MAELFQDVHGSRENWVEKFFRLGYISKGVVYCLIGVIALMAAIGLSGDEPSQTNVLMLIYEQPFGKIILAVLALGLFGYVMLRFYQAFKDIDHKGSDTKGIFSRIGYGISGLLYLALGVYAAKLVLSAQNNGGDSKQFIIAKALTYSWGQWVVGIVGLIIIGSGIYQIYRAVSGKFMKKIQLIRSNIENTVKKAGVTGYAARGVVLMIIGYLVFHAAITSNPSQAKGTEGAFAFIENNFGGVLFAVIAIGMLAYGVFMFVKAKYQRINVN